ncbi:hypothetical protein BDZ89DRAFT_1034669 [Hymenopellis radicata]|nr:hypothetical protein BDZ89DRAFT_1034669 [Hymenopellis radicata]
MSKAPKSVNLLVLFPHAASGPTHPPPDSVHKHLMESGSALTRFLPKLALFTTSVAPRAQALIATFDDENTALTVRCAKLEATINKIINRNPTLSQLKNVQVIPVMLDFGLALRSFLACVCASLGINPQDSRMHIANLCQPFIRSVNRPLNRHLPAFASDHPLFREAPKEAKAKAPAKKVPKTPEFVASSGDESEGEEGPDVEMDDGEGAKPSGSNDIDRVLSGARIATGDKVKGKEPNNSGTRYQPLAEVEGMDTTSLLFKKALKTIGVAHGTELAPLKCRIAHAEDSTKDAKVAKPDGILIDPLALGYFTQDSAQLGNLSPSAVKAESQYRFDLTAALNRIYGEIQVFNRAASLYISTTQSLGVTLLSDELSVVSRGHCGSTDGYGAASVICNSLTGISSLAWSLGGFIVVHRVPLQALSFVDITTTIRVGSDIGPRGTQDSPLLRFAIRALGATTFIWRISPGRSMSEVEKLWARTFFVALSRSKG